MFIKLFIKKTIENLPVRIAKLFSKISYSAMLGPEYNRFKKIILTNKNNEQKNNLNILKNLLLFSYENNEFYNNFYKKKHFDPYKFKFISDWKHIPIVTKKDFKLFPLHKRISKNLTGIKINTGGTSGETLDFFVDKDSFAREWAHMHFIWKQKGYAENHIKLTFRGKHFTDGNILKYNAIHNEYIVNANSTMSEVIYEVIKLSKKENIKWIHGYPSLISEFAKECRSKFYNELDTFRSKLNGVLLGSEYPAPIYKKPINKILTKNIVSWYGHSEMTILAPEIENNLYQSLPTYGLAECLANSEGESYRLVGTSFYNKVHPFIRYDTGDSVDLVSQSNNSITFKIDEGRIGDFITDKKGKKHSLTAIIFGRHHEAFNFVDHIQVNEISPGHIKLIITSNDKDIDKDKIFTKLNIKDLDIKWQIDIVKTPIRTSTGKIKLKVDY